MFVRNAVHNGSVWIHILSVFLATDSEEGGRGAFGPQKTKEDKRGDRGGKTVEDQEERGGGAESLEMVGKCCSFHFASTFTQPQHTHTIKSRLHGGSRAAIFTFSSSCLVSGGRKRSMKMGWNGSSSNTMDPTSLLSTSLFQTTLTSTMVVSWMSERVKWKRVKGFYMRSFWHTTFTLSYCWKFTNFFPSFFSFIYILTFCFALDNGSRWKGDTGKAGEKGQRARAGLDRNLPLQPWHVFTRRATGVPVNSSASNNKPYWNMQHNLNDDTFQMLSEKVCDYPHI